MKGFEIKDITIGLKPRKDTMVSTLRPCRPLMTRDEQKRISTITPQGYTEL